ncbi:MAG: tetratricopeptide repeat protein [Anaerolineales bacterium]|nr:tetratricopeptide repeat protein [Anaerolineales bacterium]
MSNYYDPRNSLLPDVLERRAGLPIMLAIVCMAIGRRLNLQIEGLAFPSHFLALYRDAAGVWVLDPFYGVVIEPDGVEAYLTQRLERPVHLSAQAWRPASAQAIAMRILHNLRNAYLMRQDLEMAGKVLDYLVAADPADALHWRERGLLHFRTERWEECQHDLRLYLTHCGHLDAIRVRPVAAAHGGQLEQLSAENQQIVTIYREAGERLARCN